MISEAQAIFLHWADEELTGILLNSWGNHNTVSSLAKRGLIRPVGKLLHYEHSKTGIDTIYEITRSGREELWRYDAGNMRL